MVAGRGLGVRGRRRDVYVVCDADVTVGRRDVETVGTVWYRQALRDTERIRKIHICLQAMR